MNKSETQLILDRLHHLNDLALELEVKSRRLMDLLSAAIDRFDPDVVDSTDD